MLQAKISNLKNNLSKYLDLVRSGETVQVLDRDMPIATIMSAPLGKSKDADEEILLRMERKGIIRRGNVKFIKKILDDPIPNGKTGVLEALLQEREEGW